MTEPVAIELRADGVAEVKRALRSVSDAFVEFDRKINRSTQAGVKDRVRASKDEGRQRAAEAKAAGRQIERIQLQELKGAQRVELEKVRAAERSNRERERAAERSASAQTKIADKAAREQTRAVEREARQQQRVAARFASQRDRIQTNSAIAASRGITRETKARQHAREQFAATVGSTATGAAGRALSTAGRVATGALALGAGFTLADVAQRNVATEKAAVLLSNSAYNPMDKNTKRFDPKALERKAVGIEGGTNFDRVDVLKAMQSYVALASDPSMLEAGNTNARQLSEIAKAGGAEIGDVFKFAGNLKVQNKNMTPEAQMNVIRGVFGQGKSGAVELDELAKVAGEITGTAGQYAGDQSVNQQKLLGLAQLGRRVTSTDESATAVRKLASDVASHADKMEAAGIHVKARGADGKVIRGLASGSDIIANLMERTGGDVGKLQALGIGERSMKLFNAAQTTFNETYEATKGDKKMKSKAAAEAVRKEIAGLEGAGYSKEDVQKDFKGMMGTKGERFATALNNVKGQIDTVLGPALERLAQKLGDPQFQEAISKLISGLGRLAEWFISNPLKGLGALIFGAVIKDLAGAGIGAAVRGALVSAAQGYNTGGVGGAAKSASGSLAVAGAVGGVLATVGGAAYTAAKASEGLDSAAAGSARMGALTSKLLRGSASPEEIAEAKQLHAAQSAKLQTAMATDTGVVASMRAGINSAGAAAIGGVTGGMYDGSKWTEQASSISEAKAIKANAETVASAIKILGKALEGVSANANAGAPQRNGPMSGQPRGGAQ